MRDPAASVVSSSRTIGPSRAPSWRARLAPYAQPHLRRSLFDIATSLVPYLGLLVAMYARFDVSYWLVLAASSTLAGNCTPFSSVANLIVLQQAYKKTAITFWEFSRVGLIVTVVTTVAAITLLAVEYLLFPGA